MEKLIIIGDIHGHYDSLMKLLGVINWFENPRKIFSLGDLLDKNPGEDNYIKLLKFCRDWHSAGLFDMVLGNHEAKQIKFQDRHIKELKTGRKNQMGPAKEPEKHEDFWATRNQLLKLQEEGWDPFKWFSQFSYYHYLLEHNACAIHGGLEPGKAPEETLEDVVCRVRNIKSNGRMASLHEVTEDMPFWTELYKGETRIFYGHSNLKEVRYDNNTIGLDTLIEGGRLSSYLLPEEVEVSVTVKEILKDPYTLVSF